MPRVSFDLSDNEPIEKPDLPAESSAGSSASGLQAWEEVSAGRFRPRRIKGSCLGRELG